MDTRQAFGKALQQVRKAKGLTQEDFSDVSSRTYLSTLERGLKSPTLDKIEDLCEALDVHPLTLVALTYLSANKGQRLDRLLDKVKKEANLLHK
jgi:transcriptional regulator with XRE-family HTH domain